MTEHHGHPKPRRTYSKHGLTLLKRAVKEIGSRSIDRRTRLGKALTQWRGDLVADLGGAEAISTQEEALVDLAVRTKLLLDSVDVWLLIQPSLVNLRKRALLPVVRERTQLADALARYMIALGLKRRAKKPLDLAEYLASRPAAPPGDGDHQTAPAPIQQAATLPPDSGPGTEGHP